MKPASEVQGEGCLRYHHESQLHSLRTNNPRQNTTSHGRAPTPSSQTAAPPRWAGSGRRFPRSYWLSLRYSLFLLASASTQPCRHWLCSTPYSAVSESPSSRRFSSAVGRSGDPVTSAPGRSAIGGGGVTAMWRVVRRAVAAGRRGPAVLRGRCCRLSARGHREAPPPAARLRSEPAVR